MKNNTTELVFILDASGSMQGLEKDTIGGFNAMIEKQRREAGECIVSTVRFDNESTVMHDRVPLAQIQPMTEEDYQVGGCTALVDAIGCAIHHISTVHKYARKEDVPERTVFMITTDGMENASHIYSSDKVKKMVKEKEEAHGWEFIFVGANIDAVETAKSYGIREECAVNYHADARGTKKVFEGLARAVSDMRSGCALSESWREEIQADFESRK